MYFKQLLPVIAAILLFLLVIMSFSIFQARVLRLDIVVLELVLPPDLKEKAYVYVSLMYPEGLRQVGKIVVDPEKALSEKMRLDLKDLREAWERA